MTSDYTHAANLADQVAESHRNPSVSVNYLNGLRQGVVIGYLTALDEEEPQP